MGGASRQAIKKYIEVTFKKVASPSALRAAIKKLVAAGTLLQDGQRFKLDKAKRVELRKPPPKPKKKKKKTVKKKKPKKKRRKRPRKRKPRKRQRRRLKRKQRKRPRKSQLRKRQRKS